MEKSRHSVFGGTLFLNAELSDAQKRLVQRKVEQGHLHRIAPGIATSLPEDQWPQLMQREKTRLASAIFPGAVVSHKSAFNAMVGPVVYLTTTSKRREVDLPGLKFIAYTGAGPAPGDKLIGTSQIYFPSNARMFLDNMTRSDGDRNATRDEIEERLLQICDVQGEESLVKLRDEMDAVAPIIGRTEQNKQIGKIIGAILGTREANNAMSPTVRAAAEGYDSARIELFDKLIRALKTTHLPQVSDVAPKGDSLVNSAFLESYFSNFIEGTEFEIEEARKIVLEGKISDLRPKDSHDILGVFKQIVDPGWRLQTLSSSAGSITQILARHANMMAARPEVFPGELKLKSNKAGNTTFVQPRLVRGTFTAGASRINELEPGLPRALYAMFLAAETHPFNDGNGRLARLLMNSELSQVGQCRIIVPTLCRETYLDCLRVLSREGDPRPFIKAMVDIQEWSAAFDYNDLDQVISTMQSCNAFQKSLIDFRLKTPDEIATPQIERERGH